MYGGERLRFRIADQNRHAICCFYSDQDAPRVGNESVRSLIRIADVAALVNSPDRVTVYLPCQGKIDSLAENRQKPPSIFVYILGRVFAKARKIKVARGKRRYAAKSCRKAVRKSMLFQFAANENFYTTEFSPIKPRIC